MSEEIAVVGENVDVKRRNTGVLFCTDKIWLGKVCLAVGGVLTPKKLPEFASSPELLTLIIMILQQAL